MIKIINIHEGERQKPTLLKKIARRFEWGASKKLKKITNKLTNLEERLATVSNSLREDLNTSIKNSEERLATVSNSLREDLNTSIKNSEERLATELTKELNPLKERISRMEDKFTFMSYQATREGIPREVKRVPGGNALLEPPHTWRRWR